MFDECQYCGACCFSTSLEYVPVTAADRQRLADADQHLVVERNGALYMRMQGGHCAALRAGALAFSCTVYADRPAVCRELERGTPACHEERVLKRATAARLI